MGFHIELSNLLSLVIYSWIELSLVLLFLFLGGCLLDLGLFYLMERAFVAILILLFFLQLQASLFTGLTEMSTRNLPGLKGGRLTTLPPSVCRLSR
jgi:hypothetical protein